MNLLMKKTLASLLALSLTGSTVSPMVADASAPKAVTLSFGSYSVTQDVYQKGIFPAFATYWKKKTGQTVSFQASFDSSGAEARAVAAGEPADVVALSTPGDIETIQRAGLITHNWRYIPYHGFVTDSVVAIAVRKGNPKHIKNWSDLAKAGVVVDLPNPATSGGAKWDIDALYGSELKQGASASAAKAFLASIYKNVQKYDSSGEISISTFASGLGDAAISYENSILDASSNLKNFSKVIPTDTLLIQNPVAIVDKDVDGDGHRTLAQAFVNFLQSPQGQNIFVKYGFRSIRLNIEKQHASKFPTPSGLFNVQNYGGWDKLNNELYSSNGIWTQVVNGQ